MNNFNLSPNARGALGDATTSRVRISIKHCILLFPNHVSVRVYNSKLSLFSLFKPIVKVDRNTCSLTTYHLKTVCILIFGLSLCYIYELYDDIIIELFQLYIQ